MLGCHACPRTCGRERSETDLGFCGVPAELRIARIALHPWEEPCISGTRGSGTVFFCGCNLRCVFCQNRDISRGGLGVAMTPEALGEQMLRLQECGAHNINLVTPTHYVHVLAPLLRSLKPQLKIPVIYNCGGYELLSALRALEGCIDIYLPDFKYWSAERAQRYSGAADYPIVALAALREMSRQVGRCQTDSESMLQRGVMVRHLVLPGGRADSIALLNALSAELGVDSFLLSLMSQYTPEFAKDTPYRELHRRVTSFEYDAVLQVAQQLGFEGYLQKRSAASSTYTPDFREQTF